VPEIADGLVEIRGVAREPATGRRSRSSRTPRGRPGRRLRRARAARACAWSSPSSAARRSTSSRGTTSRRRFVAKALSPARVREVYIDDETKEATVVVPDDQLALAIGKEGLNARLAARLTGWKVDIQSDTEFAQAEAEAAFAGADGDDFTGRCVAILSTGKRCPNAALPGLALLRRPRPPGARHREAAGEELGDLIVQPGAPEARTATTSTSLRPRSRRLLLKLRSRSPKSLGRRSRRLWLKLRVEEPEVSETATLEEQEGVAEAQA
jgi:hypothetical protein